ncbi:SDR family oxidoreductase [Streptomyces sp. NBC_00882]|uniref:SDR family NAD(P)-dependent oxidoreductase n=1 Tax=Streptomyces TaxID=1883 RepID=UPI0038701982|nr:SDR family oxidoreductase [Streptomyces sp. NBC_00882]WSZ55096.1 SDR family oxidoreductase [Streptomyces canus]
MSGEYSGSVLLVTAGAGGIGSAVARRFAREGAKVVVVDRDEERAEQVAKECGGVHFTADLSDLEANRRAVRFAVETYGTIDLVHLNTGMLCDTAIGDTFDEHSYLRLFEVNVNSVVYGIQAALPALRPGAGGSILVTASTTGLRPSPDVLYSASKHAVVGLVRSLAPRLAEAGITLNVLCPGAVDTPMLAPRREALVAAGVGLVSPERVAEGARTAFSSGRSGEAWLVNAGFEIAPFEFSDISIAGEERIR